MRESRIHHHLPWYVLYLMASSQIFIPCTNGSRHFHSLLLSLSCLAPPDLSANHLMGGGAKSSLYHFKVIFFSLLTDRVEFVMARCYDDASPFVRCCRRSLCMMSVRQVFAGLCWLLPSHKDRCLLATSMQVLHSRCIIVPC